MNESNTEERVKAVVGGMLDEEAEAETTGSISAEVVATMSQLERLEESVVMEMLDGMDPTVEAHVDQVLATPAKYLGHFGLGKSVPVTNIGVEPLSAITSSADDQDSRYEHDPNKILYYGAVRFYYPYENTNLIAIRNCVVDSKRRMDKGGAEVRDYMRTYMYVGIPASVLGFLCRGIVMVLGGSVGPRKVMKKDGYYWLTVSFTSPDDMVFRTAIVDTALTTPMEDRHQGEYGSGVRFRVSSRAPTISREAMLGSGSSSYMATVFTTGCSYSTAKAECPRVTDIPDDSNWVLNMKLAGCHLMIREKVTVDVASSIGRRKVV